LYVVHWTLPVLKDATSVVLSTEPSDLRSKRHAP
jgi:hypothetical protein